MLLLKTSDSYDELKPSTVSYQSEAEVAFYTTASTRIWLQHVTVHYNWASLFTWINTTIWKVNMNSQLLKMCRRVFSCAGTPSLIQPCLCLVWHESLKIPKGLSHTDTNSTEDVVHTKKPLQAKMLRSQTMFWAVCDLTVSTILNHSLQPP